MILDLFKPQCTRVILKFGEDCIGTLSGLIAPAVTGLLIQHATSPMAGFQLACLVITGFMACCSGLCWVFVRPQ